ncbi:MAG: rRNA maturation RNase YbeY [Cocleimonas sp.]|nr:rRNA maturation RNase YbeY [Cocleimonas sp.]
MPETREASKQPLLVELQNPYGYTHLPDYQKIQKWAEATLQQQSDASVTLRFVDQQEGLALNQTYRTKNSATNILSFVFEQPVLPEGVLLDTPLHLGDLVICLPVIEKEAIEQQKSLEQHCVHLIIHGMLHLQGYDHIEEQPAQQMEALEIDILQTLGYPNPYLNS